jgi:anthranilate phosphoribosyltransferase
MLLNTGLAEWHVPSVIKEIGRGKFGAKPMDRATAAKLYDAMLKREVSDLQLGAILLAMRIKETPEEIAGFLDACKPHFLPLPVSTPSGFAPVLIPSYNGARKKPNLTPLLALLLAREGTGIAAWCLQDAGRVTSAKFFSNWRSESAKTLSRSVHAGKAVCRLGWHYPPCRLPWQVC